ncbi:hypothetical protein [Rhodococcus qingshengii]|uniref:hypothetical protein n=1 Tax=Rhodococcus qingshengii TaxID=334542 RepID=UPI00301B484E
MNYRGYEIRAEIRTLEQQSLDDEGQVIEAISNTAEIDLEGYYSVSPEGEAGENMMSIDQVKGAVDKLLRKE